MHDSAPHPDSAGSSAERVRVYRLHDQIGRSTRGEVYRATLELPDGAVRQVAIHILAGGEDPEALARARKAADLLSGVEHPNFPRLYGPLHLRGERALVTEYVAGVDLAVLFARDGVPQRALVELVGQVAHALHAAADVAHGDLEPASILLGLDGRARLLHFGLAPAPDRPAHYQPPEALARGRHTAKGDVFALGSLLFEGLCGQRLLSGVALASQAFVAGHPARFEQLVASCLQDLPVVLEPELRAFLESMLRHDPAARPDARTIAWSCGRMAAGMGGPTLRDFVRELDPDVIPEPRPGRLTGVEHREAARGALEPSEEDVAPEDPPPPPGRLQRLPSPATEADEAPTALITMDELAAIVAGQAPPSDPLEDTQPVEPAARRPVRPAAPPPPPPPSPEPEPPATHDELPTDPAMPIPPPSETASREPAPARSSAAVATAWTGASGLILGASVGALLAGAAVLVFMVNRTNARVTPAEPAPVAAAAPEPRGPLFEPRLVDAEGVQFAPDEAPPGLYTIEADFGAGRQAAGAGTVEEGAAAQVFCSKAERSCVILP